MNTWIEAEPLPPIALIGVGSMGGAILSGLTKPGVTVDGPIRVTTHSEGSAAAVSAAAGNTAAGSAASNVIAAATSHQADANRQAVRGARVVMLAVKPWLIHDVLRDIAADLEPDAIVVSVAAGVTTDSMQALVPAGVSVVRAMPNTPSTVGLGLTGICADSKSNPDALTVVRRIFETVGEVLEVSEHQMNALAAVSGSGPAYLFLYVEEMTAAAERLGFTPQQASLLATHTVIGAAELLRQSNDTPEQLRQNVTSPKGTTEQAIRVLQEANLGELFDRALAANVRRSEQLAAGE